LATRRARLVIVFAQITSHGTCTMRTSSFRTSPLDSSGVTLEYAEVVLLALPHATVMWTNVEKAFALSVAATIAAVDDDGRLPTHLSFHGLNSRCSGWENRDVAFPCPSVSVRVLRSLWRFG
jgi:hypothetical protein